MAADSNASLTMKALFSLSSTARVLEDQRLPVAVSVTKDDVRDQLLEAWVLFHLPSRLIARMFRAKQLVNVTIHVGCESLKVSQFVKKFCGNDEHLFIRYSQDQTPLLRGSPWATL